MKIYGIGTDIVSIKRIRLSIKNKDFIKRNFNKKEVLRCNKVINYYNCYAKRFAAKEAFAKAIGTGISGDISFSAIQIERDSNGKPIFNFNNQIQMHLDNLGITHSHVSLSDEEDYAIAFVVLEK